MELIDVRILDCRHSFLLNVVYLFLTYFSNISVTDAYKLLLPADQSQGCPNKKNELTTNRAVLPYITASARKQPMYLWKTLRQIVNDVFVLFTYLVSSIHF